MRQRAAIAIQRAFRTYLIRRYRHLALNWNDDDLITHEAVHMIPRKLLCVVRDGDASHAFHSAGLLTWLLAKPVHPLTMKTMDQSVVHQCRERIVDFLSSDPVTRKRKRGHYRKRATCRKALRKYYKRFRNTSRVNKHRRFYAEQEDAGEQGAVLS